MVEVQESPSLFERLRAETRPEHDLLESTVSLASPVIDQATYVRTLQVFAYLQEQLEALYAQSIPAAILEGRSKKHLIDDDLAFLGSERLSLEGREFEFPNDLPYIAGALYVTEGSTLGGLIIAKNLRETLGYEDRGTRFFGSYGKDARRMWDSLKTDVTALIEPEDYDRVVQGARDTFALFYAHLKPVS